jgi:hypothetical protein
MARQYVIVEQQKIEDRRSKDVQSEDILVPTKYGAIANAHDKRIEKIRSLRNSKERLMSDSRVGEYFRASEVQKNGHSVSWRGRLQSSHERNVVFEERAVYAIRARCVKR